MMAIIIPMMVFDTFIELNHLLAEGTALLLLVRHLSMKPLIRKVLAIPWPCSSTFNGTATNSISMV